MMRIDWFSGGFGLAALISFAVWVLVMVGVVILFVVGIRWLLRNGGTGGGYGPGRPPAEDPALAVLRERFARGEIDATEFEERKRTLGG
jgi:putative membrane protein